MIYDLIAFGGIVFWTLFVIAFIIEVAVQDTGASVVAFLISIAVFYGLSQPPDIDWIFITSYFVVGVVWWLIVFHYRLNVIKCWINLNQDKLKTGKNLYLHSITDAKVRLYFEKEPSLATFMDRVFCWPASMLRILINDIAEELYNKIAHWLKAYKARYLNIDI